MEDFVELRAQTEEMFETEWEQRSLFGWETSIAKIHGEQPPACESKAEEKEGQYCQACRKLFSNPKVYECHLLGKRHIKAAA